MTWRNVASGASAQVEARLLERRAHADEARPHDQRDERDAEDHVGEHDRHPARAGDQAPDALVRLDEEDQRGDGDHDLGNDEREVHEHVERHARAALRMRASASAAAVPRIVAKSDDSSAILTLVSSADVYWLSRSASPNQCVVKPRPEVDVAVLVEREDDHEHDRHVQEQVHEAAPRPRAAGARRGALRTKLGTELLLARRDHEVEDRRTRQHEPSARSRAPSRTAGSGRPGSCSR